MFMLNPTLYSVSKSGLAESASRMSDVQFICKDWTPTGLRLSPHQHVQHKDFFAEPSFRAANGADLDISQAYDQTRPQESVPGDLQHGHLVKRRLVKIEQQSSSPGHPTQRSCKGTAEQSTHSWDKLDKTPSTRSSQPFTKQIWSIQLQLEGLSKQGKALKNMLSKSPGLRQLKASTANDQRFRQPPPGNGFRAFNWSKDRHRSMTKRPCLARLRDSKAYELRKDLNTRAVSKLSAEGANLQSLKSTNWLEWECRAQGQRQQQYSQGSPTLRKLADNSTAIGVITSSSESSDDS